MRSGSNPELRDGWYLSSSEFVACWLFGIGLISLALNPAPFEEQPVASTTATASITPGNAARLMWSKKAPEQWRWPSGRVRTDPPTLHRHSYSLTLDSQSGETAN
jgi:hypothetical protein